MASITKTTDIDILVHTLMVHDTNFKKVGASQDVGTKLSATVVIYHANVETIANVDPVQYLVQITPYASGNEGWDTIARFDTGTELPVTATISGAEADDSLAVASNTGFDKGDIIYIQDTGTLADSEWAQVTNLPDATTINIVDSLTNAKDSSDVIFTQAEKFTAEINLTSITRIRVIALHLTGTGSNIHNKALMITGDSIG